MVTVGVVALLGYAWMGKWGAALFFLVGLWGRFGAGRRVMIRKTGATIVIVAVMAIPAIAWIVGLCSLDVAEALYRPLAPVLDRFLAMTRAYHTANTRLLELDDLLRLYAIRLGVTLCWACTLPAMAAMVLWYDGELPEEAAESPYKFGLSLAVAFVVASFPFLIAGPKTLLSFYASVGMPALAACAVSLAASLRVWIARL
ncbi:MAG: hypothetical protein ACM3Q1_03170 [Bacteroidales bacterium]